MVEYKATFEVDGGVSKGLALKESHKYTESTTFEARSDSRAYKAAMYKALDKAMDGLSNPETGKTKVTLSKLERGCEEVDIGDKIKDLSVDSLSHFLNLTHPRYENNKVLRIFRRKLRKSLSERRAA